MTHITEERVIGNHADMGGSTTVATRTSLTVTDILPAAVRRRTHAHGNDCGPVQVGFRRRGNREQVNRCAVVPRVYY
jgi:hypothetical protein